MSLQSVYMYGYARLTVIGVCADIHKCFFTRKFAQSVQSLTAVGKRGACSIVGYPQLLRMLSCLRNAVVKRTKPCKRVPAGLRS